MNRMTGILLMTLGVSLIIIGGFVFKTSKDSNEAINFKRQIELMIDLAVADGVLTEREEQKIIALAIESNLDPTLLIKEAKSRIALSNEESETEVINHIKKSGDDFEKYVVQKFNSKYFNVVEWAGDKYVNGIYADTTLEPDLKMEFRLRNETEVFSVECKWRGSLKNGSVQFARKGQFDRYKKFELEKNIPVFIALGIGGKASSPEILYILPLRLLNSNSITKEELKQYQKNISKDFFYDAKANLLS